MALRSGTGIRLGYGVWVLPMTGPKGELILAATCSDGRMIGTTVTVPWGSDSVQIVEDLWELLEAVEPPDDARRRNIRML